MPIDVVASAFQVGVLRLNAYGQLISVARNPALDQTFRSFIGDFGISASVIGTWLNVRYDAPRHTVGILLQGRWNRSISVVCIPLKVGLLIKGFHQGQNPRDNWVKWSDIGNLDFTINRSNVAGERPLDWKGKVWALKWLGDKIVAYGENGISLLSPVENKYGLHTISRKGLRGKQAVVDVEGVHYFIDNDARLGKLDRDIQWLGYTEYLRELTSDVVLSWDAQERLVYICDGTHGFVFDPETKSLGRGPLNVTGIGYQSGQRYVVASGAIDIPPFEFTTDTFDFGSRAGKTIHSIEVGVDTVVELSVACEYRLSKSGPFILTTWAPLDARGVRYFPCFGYEFRFHFRAVGGNQFHVDYLKVNGHVHDY